MRFLLLVLLFTGLLSCSRKTGIGIKNDGHLWINVTLNDSVTGNFMFDTGATGVLLDSTFYFHKVHQSGNKLSRAKLAGAGKNLQDIDVLNDSMVVRAGEYSRMMYEPIIFNSRSIFGDSCDGIIGWDFFRDKILTIDHENKILTVADEVSDVSFFTKIPFQFIQNKIILKATLLLNKNVSVKGDFFIDTGFKGAIALTTETVNKYNLIYLNDRELFQKKNTGIGGDAHGFRTKALKFAFDVFELDSVPVICLLNQSGGLSQAPYNGNIGNNILERFTVVIDFKERVLYIKPSGLFNSQFL